jgi:probable HAF family extracellular repeat protein
LVVGRTEQSARASTIVSMNELAQALVAYSASADHSSISGAKAINAFYEGAVVYSGGSLQSLPTFGTYQVTIARDVNDAGQIVGIADHIPGGYEFARGFVYSGGSFTELPVFGTSGFTHAYGINNAGTIVGSSISKPFRFTIGGSSLTALPTPVGGDGTGAGNAVNLVGDIAGWATVAALKRPVMWHNGAASTLILPAGATSGQAIGITDSGLIFGQASYPDLSTRSAIYRSGFAATDMGTLGGTYSEPTDANTSGKIVGWSTLSGGGGTPTAFLYDGGTMIDLNTFLPPASGWVLNKAYTIDDQDEIVGIGTLNGVSTGFKLSLGVPEPGALVPLVGVMWMSRHLIRRPLYRRATRR